MSASGKDVIYVDIDDEITALIDKVRSSPERIIALVLPKRATVLQSIVNMKLLKRTSDEAKKHVVLITTELGLLPLAGAVGLFVAKNLQSKPEIPTAPAGMHDDSTEDIDEPLSAVGAVATGTEGVDKAKTVGELAGQSGAAGAVAARNIVDEDTIELDNADDAPLSSNPALNPAGKLGKSQKEKKFKIPDFNRFRLLLVLGGALLVLLIAGWWAAFVKMPKATVLVKTNSTAVNSAIDVELKTNTTSINVDENIVPAKSEQTQKTSSQQVDATGTLDKGEKASGSIRFYNCNVQDALTGTDRVVPAGTGVSANGLTFITSKAVIVPASHFKADQTTCKKDVPSASVEMVAQKGGEKYNVAASSYSVSGYSTISGEGSATTGGTTQVVKIVSQADIDSAKQKMTTQDANEVKLELTQALVAKELLAVEATLASGTPDITTSAKVGDEVTTVTVTQKVTYTMLGINQDDLKKIIENTVAEKIDTSKQVILDYGISKAAFNLANQSADGALVGMEVTTTAGPELNAADLKKQVAGKKANDAKKVLKEHPGVTDVEVTYSPFWVSAIPKNTSKITLVIEEPKVTSDEKR